MVFDDPPAPAARLELGFFSAVDAAAPARRLCVEVACQDKRGFSRRVGTMKIQEMRQ